MVSNSYQTDKVTIKMKLIKDNGLRFPHANSKQKKRYGIYECEVCGIQREYDSYSIKNRINCSCMSCTNKSRSMHNMSKTRLYTIYVGIKQRCMNPNNPGYVYYGERGITICEEWKVSFESFKEWSMKNRYAENFTIDRIDTNGNYEPGNCRWVSRNIQARNTRIRCDNTSGYRGVSWHIRDKYWSCQIMVNKKSIVIGKFENAIDAGIAYDKYIDKFNLEHTKNFT